MLQQPLQTQNWFLLAGISITCNWPLESNSHLTALFSSRKGVALHHHPRGPCYVTLIKNQKKLLESCEMGELKLPPYSEEDRQALLTATSNYICSRMGELRETGLRIQFSWSDMCNKAKQLAVQGPKSSCPSNPRLNYQLLNSFSDRKSSTKCHRTHLPFQGSVQRFRQLEARCRKATSLCPTAR